MSGGRVHVPAAVHLPSIHVPVLQQLAASLYAVAVSTQALANEGSADAVPWQDGCAHACPVGELALGWHTVAP